MENTTKPVDMSKLDNDLITKLRTAATPNELAPLMPGNDEVEFAKVLAKWNKEYKSWLDRVNHHANIGIFDTVPKISQRMNETVTTKIEELNTKLTETDDEDERRELASKIINLDRNRTMINESIKFMESFGKMI